MITITGTIEDTTGAPQHALLEFKSISTPLAASGGIITANSDNFVRTDPSDGTFSIQLVAGNYTVTITTGEGTTTFNIAVPAGTSTVTIDTLITTPFSYTFTPPASTWNGQWAGAITFVPMANPAAPTTAPEIFGGGHQGVIDAFAYKIAWQNASGQTLGSPDVISTGPTGSNNATRVTFPTPPSGVTAILLYRSTNDSTTNRYLLATLSPTATFYDDWESTADFNARLDVDETSPTVNTTAGQLIGNPGNFGALAITAQGVALQQLVFMLGTNARWKPGYGLQLYNQTTGLWHTLLCAGNPAQLGFDAGMN